MAAKVFKEFFGMLVKMLPMDDPIFRGELYSHDLLHGDYFAQVQSSDTTRAQKAEHFLTSVIKPELDAEISTKKFEDLLEILSTCGHKPLADKIQGMLTHGTSATSLSPKGILLFWFVYLL